MITKVLGMILIGSVLVGPIMSDVEKPVYEVLKSQENIEVRRYLPMVIAKVALEGQRKAAISDGFRLLADYIFGNNTATQNTAVQLQKSTKIAMTAPVQQQAVNGLWEVSFIMPAQYHIKTLPKPNNRQIRFEEVPSTTYVAIQFAGTASDQNIKKHEKQLINYAKDKQMTVIGSPKYAFYNPPWTLPFMRRNEVMIAIQYQ